MENIYSKFYSGGGIGQLMSGFGTLNYPNNPNTRTNAFNNYGRSLSAYSRLPKAFLEVDN